MGPLALLPLALALAQLAQPAAAQTSAEVAASVPRVTFEWTLLPSDAPLVYEPWDAWWANMSHITTLPGGQSTIMATNTTGANMTVAFWGNDIYVEGSWAPDSEFALWVDGAPFATTKTDAAQNLIAYTAGNLGYGHHTATLVLARGSLSVRDVRVRYYAFMSDVPADKIIGTNYLVGGSDAIAQSAQLVIGRSGELNPFFTPAGDWLTRSETGTSQNSDLYVQPYWAAGAGGSLSFGIPKGTTFMRVNGTPSAADSAFTFTLDPPPLDGAPGSVSLPTRRGRAYMAPYAGGIGYVQLPLDPTREYTATVAGRRGEIGVYGVTFFASAYDPGWNPANAGGGRSESGSAASITGNGGGSNGSGSGDGAGKNGGGDGTGAGGGNGGDSASGKAPVGAIAGGVVGGVLLLALGVGFFLWRRNKAKKRRDTLFLVDQDPDPPLSPFRQDAGRGEKDAPFDDSHSELSPRRPPPAVMKKHLEITTNTGYVPPAPPAAPRAEAERAALRVDPAASRLPTPAPVPPRSPHSPATPHTAPAALLRRPWQPEAVNDVDAGRIVALVPPRYDPAWKDEGELEEGQSAAARVSRAARGREDNFTL